MRSFLCWMVILVLLVAPHATHACRFCPRDVELPDPDMVIYLTSSTNTTCGQLSQEVEDEFLVLSYGCDYYKYHAHLCGCPPTNLPERCTLCQDGQELREVSRASNNAQSNKCAELAIEAQYDPFSHGCGHYYYLGSLCGCSNNEPRTNGCSLCADGSDPQYASQPVRLPGIDEDEEQLATCQHANEYLKFAHKSDSLKCQSTQSTLGGFCGCPNNSTTEQIQSACPICLDQDGMELSDNMAPTFSHLSINGGTIMHQSGKTCLETEMLANELVLMFEETGNDNTTADVCSGIRDQVAESCCRQPVQSSIISDSSSAVSFLLLTRNAGLTILTTVSTVFLAVVAW